jgi:hypothetical protein
LIHYNLDSSIYMKEHEFVNTFKSMIESNQPYYCMFDIFIHFALDNKFFMNYYEMHRAVLLYIRPYASPELLTYFKKNIDNL